MLRVAIGAVGAAMAVAALPTPASATAPDVFIRYEEDAQADWTVIEDCADGTQAQVFVSVIGGLEFESPDLTDVNEFVNVQVQGSRCDGAFLSGRGNGAADYQGSPTLRRARVIGTITLNDGAVASVDVQWTGTGRLETSVNPTRFPGFVGIFRSREREASATGTVSLDGVTLVSGASDSAAFQTFEDLNITYGTPSG